MVLFVALGASPQPLVVVQHSWRQQVAIMSSASVSFVVDRLRKPFLIGQNTMGKGPRLKFFGRYAPGSAGAGAARTLGGDGGGGGGGGGVGGDGSPSLSESAGGSMPSSSRKSKPFVISANTSTSLQPPPSWLFPNNRLVCQWCIVALAGIVCPR